MSVYIGLNQSTGPVILRHHSLMTVGAIHDNNKNKQ